MSCDNFERKHRRTDLISFGISANTLRGGAYRVAAAKHPSWTPHSGDMTAASDSAWYLFCD